MRRIPSDAGVWEVQWMIIRLWAFATVLFFVGMLLYEGWETGHSGHREKGAEIQTERKQDQTQTSKEAAA